MAQLKNFSKIIHNGNEMGKVLHQGKTIWAKETGVYLAKDSDFVEVNGHWIYRGARSQVEIPTHINGQLVTSTQYMFSGNSTYAATRVTKVVLEHSNVTDTSYMFYYSKATTLDLSSFNTSNVTDMKNMFYYSSATTLDLSSFNTSNVTDMSYMLFRASATTLDLSSFNTSKVTNMANMFRDSRTTILDLSSFDTSNVGYVSWMFGGANTTVGYARTQADADKFNSSSYKPAGLNFVVKPYLAQDRDFVKVDGHWVYRGAALEVEIPTHINGQLVTSTHSMFRGDSTYSATPVTKVVLNHSNVTDMTYMFRESSATILDLSSFDASNVTNTFYTFLNVSATTGYARTQADADKFNTSMGRPAGLNFVVKP